MSEEALKQMRRHASSLYLTLERLGKAFNMEGKPPHPLLMIPPHEWDSSQAWERVIADLRDGVQVLIERFASGELPTGTPN